MNTFTALWHDTEKLGSTFEEHLQRFAIAHAARQPGGQEPALYQVRPRSFDDGEGWRKVTKREYDDYGEFPGYPESEWERRALYAAPPAQAVRQEPVASVEFIGGNAAELVFTGPAMPDGQHDLYAAPPAQAVDLRQFRPAVRCLINESWAKADIEEAKRLLALIDKHKAS